MEKIIQTKDGKIKITGIHNDGSIEIHQTRQGDISKRTKHEWVNIPAKELAQFVKELGI